VKGEHWHTNLEDRMREHHIHGLSIAVFEHYHLLWARGFGFADVNTRQPVTETTLFQAGSISKAVNAVAVLEAVEQGKLALDTPINDALRSWKLGDNELTRQHAVTLRELLSHTAGTNIYGFKGYRSGAALPTLVQILDGAAPANTEKIVVDGLPGKGFRYSGGGTMVTELALVDQLGRPYPELMAEAVLGPLAMTHSTYEQPLPQARVGEAATGYHADGGEVPDKRMVYPEMAAAGLWTTPSDLATFLIEVQLARAGRSSKISKQVATELTTPVAHVEGDDSIGLGMYLMKRDGAELFGHDGWDEGFQAEAIASLDGGYGVVVMANSDNLGEILFDVERAIFAEYGWPMAPELVRIAIDPAALAGFAGVYGKPGDPIVVSYANDKLFAHRPFESAVELVPVGAKRFVTVGGQDTYTFDAKLTTAAPLVELEAGRTDTARSAWMADPPMITERAASRVGRDLLQRKQPQLAVTVFELIGDVFPDSASAHANLGEAYEAAGDKPHAIASYQAALATLEHGKVADAALEQQLRATCTAALARLAH
jgi:CubicO group peptidase (beta-lactamase class C family)